MSEESISRRLIYKVPEVAEMLGLNRKKIYQMMDRGEIPTRRVGRRWAIFIADFEAFMQGLPKKGGQVL